MPSAVPKEEVSGTAVFDRQAELSLGQGIRVPTCCFSLSMVPSHCAAAACKAAQELPRNAIQGRDSNHRLHFIFTNRGEEKGMWQFFSCSWKALLLPNFYARLAPKKQQCRVAVVLGAVQAAKT